MDNSDGTQSDQLFRELLSFSILPFSEKLRFIPFARTAPMGFDLISGEVRTTFPLQFLVSLITDVFSTEKYLPPMNQRCSESMQRLLGLLHLMLWCKDDRLWDPRVIEVVGGHGEIFAAVWDLLQIQANQVALDLGFQRCAPAITYERLTEEWGGRTIYEKGNPV